MELGTRFGSEGLEHIPGQPHIVCVSLGNSSSLTLHYFLLLFVQMKCAKHEHQSWPQTRHCIMNLQTQNQMNDIKLI